MPGSERIVPNGVVLPPPERRSERSAGPREERRAESRDEPRPESRPEPRIPAREASYAEPERAVPAPPTPRETAPRTSGAEAAREIVPAPVRAEAVAPVRRFALELPTSNNALLQGRPSAFYQRLDIETIPGLRNAGWEGGQYGFVRNQARTPAGPTFTRVHQGVDIQPRFRDRAGVPLDTVVAVDAGRVVYVNRVENQSSYGLYVVVEHMWDGAPVYSLSAHLASIWVRPGDEVSAGAPLGRMGYTGRGLNRARAHLHLEIGLMLNEHFQPWFDRHVRARNHHGKFNGMNFQGLNVSALYIALRDDPTMHFARFVQEQPVAYRLALPGTEPLDVLRRYPWLAGDGLRLDGTGAWVVGFTREGVPVEVTRQAAPVSQPEVIYVTDEIVRGHLSTRGYLERQGSSYRVAPAGRRMAALLQTTARGVPAWLGS